MNRHHIAVYVSAGLLLGCFGVPASAATTKAAPKPVVLVPRKLDGVWVPKGQENLWPVAVMIDNHTAARPQSGLQSASVVYESLAEGGIPRFMALYADRSEKEIGPVRSTRPYFVREAAETNAAVVHAGGSPDGMQLLTKLRMPNIDGLKKFAKFFFRAHGGGVHGFYTSGAKIIAALHQAGTDKVHALYRSWKFGEGAALSQRPNGKHGAQIDLGYGKAYTIEYRYDKKSNSYLRFTGGKVHKDRLTNKQITVRNVIVMNVPKEKVLDKKGRLDIKVTGKGTGYLLQNGKVTAIKWSKASDRARTIFTTKSGTEITFIRGNTWIDIVPAGQKYKVY